MAIMEADSPIAKDVSFDKIVEVAAEYFDIEKTLLFRKSRKREIIIARHIIQYLAYKKSRLSLKRIGLLTGGRDHTTVIHAKTKVEHMLATNDDVYAFPVKELLERLCD